MPSEAPTSTALNEPMSHGELLNGPRTLRQSLSVVRPFAVGCYQLAVRLRPSIDLVNLLVYVGEHEIGCATVHDSIADDDGSLVCRFPFVVEHPGERAVRMCIVDSFHGEYGDVPDQCVTVISIVAEPRAAPPVTDAVQELPGTPCLDLWGWTSMAWEAHGHRFRVGEAYLHRRGIREPWKWGGNFIQTHAYSHKDWHREFVKLAHGYGFLVDEHGFPPQRRPEKRNGRMYVFRTHIQGDRRLPKSQEHLWPTRYVAAHTLAFVKRWAHGFSNALRDGWRGAIDGWETEEYAEGKAGVLSCLENMIALNHALWRYNPGICIGSCNHTAGYRQTYRIWLHEGFHGPNFVHVAMDAGSSWRHCLPGYDDHVPPGCLPDERSFRNAYNDIFLGYQADSRTYSGNDLGNLTLPDWLIKQSHDFCRSRARGDHRAPPSALFWLNDGPSLLPEEIREYAYIACHDAPRNAVAMNLGSTGIDGRFRWLRDAFADYLGEDGGPLPSELILRDRERLPASTAVLQNNHLRLERSAQGEGGQLRCDLEGTGHFDNDSLSLVLVDQVFQPACARATCVFKREKVTVKHIAPWQYCDDLKPGTYRLRATCLPPAPHSLAVRVNGWLVGLIGEDQSEVCFCMPEHGSYTISLSPHKPAMASSPAECVELLDVELMREDSGQPPLRHRIDTLGSNAQRSPHVIVHDEGTGLPALLGEKGVTLLDWPIRLSPGSYLLVVRARPKDSAEPTQLRLGLDRHRFHTKHFSGLKQYAHLAEDLDARHVPAAYSRIGRIDMLSGERPYVIPFNVYEDGTHTLEFVNAGAPLHLKSVSIYDMPMCHTPLVKGGVQAVLDERCAINEASLTRQYELVNDRPAIRCHIANHCETGVQRVSVLNRRHYPHVQKHKNGMTLRSGCHLYPDIHLLVRGGQDGQMLSSDQRQVWCEIAGASQATFDLVVAVGPYENVAPDALAGTAPPETIRLRAVDEGKPWRMKSKGADPVSVVEIADPEEGPYLVHEHGWWRVRGAQPVADAADERAYLQAYRAWLDRNEKARPSSPRFGEKFVYHSHTADPPPQRRTARDLLKVYADHHDVRVQPWGFIYGTARPGYGCQYTMALADVVGDEKHGSCRVRVTRTTAYLFAPRVEFRQPVAFATLDGEPWHYIDGTMVMLPQRSGEYVLTVTYGRRVLPAITRTAACVKQTRVGEDGDLILTLGLPEYVREIPDGLAYHVALRVSNGKVSPRRGSNIKIVRRCGDEVIARAGIGELRIDVRRTKTTGD